MKSIGLAIIVVPVAGSFVRSEVPSVAVAGLEYRLAAIEFGDDGSVTNEYVPEGQTIET